MAGRDARSTILETAAALFEDRGYAAATIDEIARRSGYSRAHVYKLFATKENLYLEVISSAPGALDERWSQELEASDSDERSLGSLARALARFEADLPKQIATSLEFAVAAQHNPDVQARFRVLQAEFDRLLGDLLVRQCHALGVEPPSPPRELAVQVYALYSGLLIRRLTDPDLDVAEHLSHGLSLMLSGGVGPDPQPAKQAPSRRRALHR